MTSRSRRKHPTTASSTAAAREPRGRAVWASARAAVVAAVVVGAAEAAPTGGLRLPGTLAVPLAAGAADAARTPPRTGPARSWALSVPPAGVIVDPAAVAADRRRPSGEVVLTAAEADAEASGPLALGNAAADGAAAADTRDAADDTALVDPDVGRPGGVPAREASRAQAGRSAVDDRGQRGDSARDAKDKQDRKDRKKDACADQAGECREALAALRDDDIAGIGLDIRVGGRPGSDYPCECRLEGETYKPRRFATTLFTWKAPGYCHHPLYFEDWMLERYGHSHGYLDPVFSGAHFFVTLTVLPYKMGVELPWECMYPLGHYRPGDCAPWMVPAVPISCRGFAVQGATVTGLVFLLP